MIAVLAEPSEHDVVREFFELFKTPWCFFRDGCRAEVLLCSGDEVPANTVGLVLGRRELGFDLFAEVRRLLTIGQSSESAASPTLEQHIATLRDQILAAGISVTEIPPVPAGSAFIGCLTHDVDHARILYHRFDHSSGGFLARALVGSLVDWRAGRKDFGQVAQNWRAAASLPLAYAGLAPDCWDQFERYLTVEGSLPSTFFFVTRPNHAGKNATDAKRAVRYTLEDVAGDIAKLRNAGREIAVHGIDAWCDAESGRAERESLNQEAAGVRMHWLYFDEQSPAKLEAAGFEYDSTVGFNNTVGYRAGTVQCFKPLAVERLLELPLHIMDTALFFPSHLHLTEAEAENAIAPLLENAQRFGGVLTVNWHDRSLGPERLWERPYARLIEAMRERRAWFATAADTVRWFRKRRAATFEMVHGGELRVKAASDDLPALQLRVSSPGAGAARDLPITTPDLLVAA